jgi:methylthioribose-1-phosphate isomerase
MSDYFTIRWIDGCVRMIDQRRLPHEVCYLDFYDVAGVAGAIRDMVIRGAPAIGAAAGFGLALAAVKSEAVTCHDLWSDLQHAGETLMRSRPTAVNLTWAVNRILQKIHRTTWVEVSELRAEVIKEALAIAAEDAQINRQMAKYGLEVVPQKARIIHHCNTGSLATVDYGTALGVIRAAHENGRNVFVYVDETRPRLQGARLTAWELQQLGIPYTVIADGASGYFMRQGKIDLCFVGCDRVASNGDTANKIGTYNLALAAYAHGIPFYVVGPTSTVDLQLPSGEEIPIENRPASEITWVEGVRIAPAGADASNPAFDITPAQFITAIITEKGIAVPPYQESLARLCGVL